MILRTVKVILIILCFCSMHEILYFGIIQGISFPENLKALWWVAWVPAAPLTLLGVLIPYLTFHYIKYGGLP